MTEYHAHKAGPIHRTPVQPLPTEPVTTDPTVPADGEHPVIQTTEVNGDGGVPGTTGVQ